MEEFNLAIESDLKLVRSVEAQLAKVRTKQVDSSDVRGLLKGLAVGWFRNGKPTLLKYISQEKIDPIENTLKYFLEVSDRRPSKIKCLESIKELKSLLIKVRAENIGKIAKVSGDELTTDSPPDFSPLVSDEKMKAILINRWVECQICVSVKAPLAATVMMGGLLEALFLARINREKNKNNIFTAKASPKDENGKTLQMKEWTLKDFIDVAHELKWISQTAKDLGVVLRDYRNYIHPYKQYSHGLKSEDLDSGLLWDLFKSLSKQIIKS